MPGTKQTQGRLRGAGSEPGCRCGHSPGGVITDLCDITTELSPGVQALEKWSNQKKEAADFVRGSRKHKRKQVVNVAVF